MLEKEGYEVTAASNGLAGLRKAQVDVPDLLILDVMLPGIDGFEVCHRLRIDARTSQLPILMMSAKGQDEDRATGLRVGASDFLQKPVDRAVLLERIQALLSGST
jgi:DNA-binding response OmpR family regulator